MCDDIIKHELGDCDEFCYYCYNELPEEVSLDEFLNNEREDV